MHFKISILLFFCCWMVGCTLVPNEMKIAGRIMEAHPDSALSILRHLNSAKYKSGSDRALYGLLLFQALDKRDKPLQPDSLIDYSISYFLGENDDAHLAACYFYKGHKCKRAQHFDEAASFYLKSLDYLQNKNDNYLLGRIYSDMGDMCAIQRDYKESLKKYRYSLDCFNKAGKTIDAGFEILSIGRMHYFLKDSKAAQWYYRKVLLQTNDSMLCGAAYQEMGVNFYQNKQFDSAQYYLRKSLRYPFKGTNYSIRSFSLSDLLFDLGQSDSSFQYATIALKYPATFYTQRDCYRILTNIEYTRKNLKQMGIYMSHYQDCNDSIHKLQLQTKCTALEKIHGTTEEAKGAKRNMLLIVSGLLIITLFCLYLIYFLYKRNKLKNEQLDGYKKQLNRKQEFVSHSLSKKIEEARSLQTEMRKAASVEERVKLDKELYNNTLYLDNWEKFSREMNHAFNNIIITLKSKYPAITRKEKIWCCLQLLDIPHADRMLLLEASSDSLYKLKQRLAHKLNLKTTKDLDRFLKELTEIKD